MPLSYPPKTYTKINLKNPMIKQEQRPQNNALYINYSGGKVGWAHEDEVENIPQIGAFPANRAKSTRRHRGAAKQVQLANMRAEEAVQCAIIHSEAVDREARDASARGEN